MAWIIFLMYDYSENDDHLLYLSKAMIINRIEYFIELITHVSHGGLWGDYKYTKI